MTQLRTEVDRGMVASLKENVGTIVFFLKQHESFLFCVEGIENVLKRSDNAFLVSCYKNCFI